MRTPLASLVSCVLTECMLRAAGGDLFEEVRADSSAGSCRVAQGAGRQRRDGSS